MTGNKLCCYSHGSQVSFCVLSVVSQAVLKTLHIALLACSPALSLMSHFYHITSVQSGKRAKVELVALLGSRVRANSISVIPARAGFGFLKRCSSCQAEVDLGEQFQSWGRWFCVRRWKTFCEGTEGTSRGKRVSGASGRGGGLWDRSKRIRNW